MHIGLIGGIGPAATDAYYRRIVLAMEGRGRPLEMTVVHTGSPTLLANMAAGRVEDQAQLFRRLTERLVAAGAECVAVTSIAGHFCIERFKEISPLPVVDLLTTVAEAVSARGIGSVGLLGTGTVMGNGFYGALGTVQTLAPEGDAFDAAHTNYVAIASAGQATPEQAAFFLEQGQGLIARGAEAVLLGGTDLALVFDGANAPFPVIDCVEIHSNRLVAIAADEIPPTA